MNWKVSLDMYLTSPPDDGFDGWAEDLFDCFDDVFYNTNEKWIDEYDGVCNKWLNKLFYDTNPDTYDTNVFSRMLNLTSTLQNIRLCLHDLINGTNSYIKRNLNNV